MKTNLIRTLAILMLGSSMSAFAANSNPCSGNEKAKNSENQSQTSEKEEKKEKKAAHQRKDQKDKDQQQEKTDQEKEFDRMLQGIWG
jgi:Ni/Co efflux regulator RcnB